MVLGSELPYQMQHEAKNYTAGFFHRTLSSNTLALAPPRQYDQEPDKLLHVPVNEALKQEVEKELSVRRQQELFLFVSGKKSEDLKSHFYL